ncbi:SapC family protein [Niveispirillum sp.]|uniref:SapC family protein n=1 Tax=Niveispirillum sp. TaxID=1917217 RepID=UPI001B69F589|nr:SapC family protein [Niveispirillum sp.]MBP7338656.1 SapC family protein [Niveispirillum sp.]
MIHPHGLAPCGSHRDVSPSLRNTETMPAATSAPAPALPLFYGTPTLLRFPEHRLLGIREGVDYGFARMATAIPLVAAEFMEAQRSYPIVFSTEEGAAPLAVTGLATGENLFVAPDGSWKAGHYIPSYLRRYPFIGMTPPGEGNNIMLGLDIAAPQVSTDAARDRAHALFTEDGQASEAATAAITFCEAYALEYERTRTFSAALEDANLLVIREAIVTLPDWTEKRVQGFRLVDEEAFRKLSGAKLKTFHANGWTDLVTLHLASQTAWRNLVNIPSSAS